MTRVGLLSERWSNSAIRLALEGLRDSQDIELETLGMFLQSDSYSQAVWSLIGVSDVLVAEVTGDSRNLWYEIGLAHGVGKPVVVVTSSPEVLPAHLLSQRFLVADPQKDPTDYLAFRLREAIDEAARRGSSAAGYLGAPAEHPSESRAFARVPVTEFRALYAYNGVARMRRFEEWFELMAGAISGWDIKGKAGPRKVSSPFDFVIWSSRGEQEIKALGNPIAVELKSISGMSAANLERLLEMSRTAGLRTVILATTGVVSPASLDRAARAGQTHGVNLVVLGRDDLMDVHEPGHLLDAVVLRARDLLYGGR